MKTLKINLAAVAALSLGMVAVNAQVYNNSSISQNITYFGNPNTATYGQSFTAPGGVLDSWTFYLGNEGGTAQNFEFFVMGWNGSEATGPVLYQSAPQTISGSQSSDTAFTVDPDIALTAGGSYVMFINESGTE